MFEDVKPKMLVEHELLGVAALMLLANCSLSPTVDLASWEAASPSSGS